MNFRNAAMYFANKSGYSWMPTPSQSWSGDDRSCRPAPNITPISGDNKQNKKRLEARRRGEPNVERADLSARAATGKPGKIVSVQFLGILPASCSGYGITHSHHTDAFGTSVSAHCLANWAYVRSSAKKLSSMVGSSGFTRW